MISGKIFAANWKLHKSPSQSRDFFELLFYKISNAKDEAKKHQFMFFPTSTSLESSAHAIQSFLDHNMDFKGRFRFGCQNTHTSGQGAFTGEISASLVQEMNADLVLIGHSERRKIFGETDELLSQKIQFVQSLGMTSMFCIGETLEERQSGKTNQVLENQIRVGLSKVMDKAEVINAKGQLIVAYEPVWAIGTGQVATAEQVEQTHQEVKSLLKRLNFSSTPVLYGGSVKPDNSKSLLALPSVDGFLIGGAALEVESYLKIAGIN